MSDSNAGVTSSTGTHFTCVFKTFNDNVDEIGIGKISGKAILLPEEGKKSSYLLQPKQDVSQKSSDENEESDYYSFPKPAHLVVERSMNSNAPPANSKSHRPFFFGGLQIVFSAKNIEVYLTNLDEKETYLMTCKGIPFRVKKKEDNAIKSVPENPDGIEWRRAICVVPGGPRNISRLRIKPTGSSSETESKTIKLHYLKLTARIVNNSPNERTVTNPPIPTTTSQRMEQSPRHLIPSMATLGMGAVAPTQMPPSEPPLTQSDLGAAMSGLSFMARKTEENMANLFRQQSTKMEEHMNSCFSGLEMQMCSLKHTLAAQYQLIQENQIIMKEQQGIIEYQTAQIEKLANDNDELKEKMRSLQEDISIFRLQGPCNNANKDEIKKTVEEKRMGAGGCGSMLYATEVDMMNGINEMISFHMSPLITAQDSTIPLKDIRNNKDDEDYTHTSNIEVKLVEDDPVTVNEQVEGEDNSADDHDNYSGDDNNNNRDDCEEVSRKHESNGEPLPEGHVHL